MAWATQSPSKQTNTLEQKDAKIAKKSKTGNDFRRFQSVFQRRPQPPLEALPAFFLRDLCDLLFSCFRVFTLVQGIFMLDRTRKTSGLRAGRHSVSVSFRPFRGQSSSTMAWAPHQPSTKTNTLEQKNAKIAKKSKTGNDVRCYQYMFQRRRQPPLEALSASSLRARCGSSCSSCLFGFDRDSGAAISNSAASSCRRVSAIGRLRYCYQMDMIGHQAIRQDLDLESVAPLCHELDVALVIFVTGKRLLSAVSALTRTRRTMRGP